MHIVFNKIKYVFDPYISSLHEDLRYDYEIELTELNNYESRIN